jgi:metal-responsive CopG/Arc/MetJ family transcriptional regulator
MRAVLSLSLPENMSAELDSFAKKTGRNKSDVVKEALMVYLWEERFKKARKSLSGKAKKAGIVTDEDLFKAVS